METKSRVTKPGMDMCNVALQGEDEVRQSGVPFAVVRPCALTEEPAGAELVFSQGDTIKVIAHCFSLLLHCLSICLNLVQSDPNGFESTQVQPSLHFADIIMQISSL